MSRPINPLVPFFALVALAGVLIGLVFKNADPVVQVLAMMVAVVGVHELIFDSPRD